MQEMHFKPPDQARQPTFASEKPDGDGREETVEIIPITDIKGRGLRQSIRAEGKREVVIDQHTNKWYYSNNNETTRNYIII